MKRLKGLFIILSVVSFENVIAHTCEGSDNALWTRSPEYQRVIAHMGELFQCINTDNPTEYTLRDRTACNWLVGKGIELIYGDSSFKSGNGYMTANTIATKLQGQQIAGWKSLGAAGTQANLTLAGSIVEQGKPVIAAWKNQNGHGHVNIIIPGGLARSSSWGLDVPNSVNLSLDSINQSYIGCRLSAAFGGSKKGDVYLYTTK